MSRPVVTWFANPHEHSLHYVKFGLMRLAQRGEIRLVERPGRGAQDLPAAVRDHAHRRTVAVRVRSGALDRLLVLDGEDSVFQTSPLIEHCDLYLSCSYNGAFFRGEPFRLALPWQTDAETAWYREEYARLQNRFRPHLHKARPLAPIGPDLEWTRPQPLWRRKLDALRHRLALLRGPRLDWHAQHRRFSRRWAHLHALREEPIRHDVVLKDSLWGWPRHRVALHRRLAGLSARADIRAELRHLPPTHHAGPADPSLRPEDFPLVCGGGVGGDYETMLARSRLAVFATGFHWGCRNIVTLAWFLGLKVLSDPFAHETWFDFTELETEFTAGSGDWSEVDALLARFSRADALAARPRIRAAFDRLMGPEACARKALESALAADAT
jgi:hypothetical protein